MIESLNDRSQKLSKANVSSGKGQNVENHFIESQKKNIESLKFEKDQNIESIFRTSKV